VTILPRLCRRKCGYNVKFMQLADPRVSRTVGWVAKAGAGLRPAARHVIECVRQQVRERAKEFGYAAL